jgi:hypothetical protein
MPELSTWHSAIDMGGRASMKPGASSSNSIEGIFSVSDSTCIRSRLIIQAKD